MLTALITCTAAYAATLVAINLIVLRRGRPRPSRRRIPLAILALTTLSGRTAGAHFAFVVPDAGGRHARLILSEDLAVDPAVPADLLAGASLSCGDTPVALRPAGGALALDLPGTGPRVVHGTADAGVSTHDPAHPFLIVYYPKAVVGGDPFGRTAAAPVELTAVGRPGHLSFRLTAAGKAVPAATVTVIRPDDQADRAVTDGAGQTKPFDVPGRYGAWAKVVESTPGDRGGKHYDQVRRYATLVVDAPAATLPPMPQPAASFGAVTAGGYLYVYGGHVAPTHDYSTASVSGQFHRLRLDGGSAWESLPAGPPLQGMNLATDGKFVYRVGGMRPRNAPGQPADVRSVADVDRYDPAGRRWDALPPLPTPRSSHDLAVVNHTLYVVGGWDLTGDADAATFAPDALSLDLSTPDAKWRSVAQPLQRRALTVAVHGGRVYAIGGFDASADPSLQVDVLDPATGRWSAGPALPGPDGNGFGPAACAVGDALFASVADGSVYRLDDRRGRWEKVAATTPRIVHRAVADGPSLLVLGGAAGKRQLDVVEAVPVTMDK